MKALLLAALLLNAVLLATLVIVVASQSVQLDNLDTDFNTMVRP